MVCAIQAIALAALAVGALVTTPDNASGAVAQAVLLVVMAALLGWISWALVGAKPWTRGPVIATELVVLLVAFSWAGPTTVLGWLIGVPALAALVTMFRPTVIAAVYARDEASSD